MNEICVRKEDTKISGQKGGSGDETTLIGVCAQSEVHTIQFSLHMQSGSSQHSLGDSIKFFFPFLWWEKASASRQGQRMKTQFFSKREETFFIAHEKVLAQDFQKTLFLRFFWGKKAKEEKQNS